MFVSLDDLEDDLEMYYILNNGRIESLDDLNTFAKYITSSKTKYFSNLGDYFYVDEICLLNGIINICYPLNFFECNRSVFIQFYNSSLSLEFKNYFCFRKYIKTR